MTRVDLDNLSRPIVCVDLNGVLDAYTGWKHAGHWDPPRPGARRLDVSLGMERVVGEPFGNAQCHRGRKRRDSQTRAARARRARSCRESTRRPSSRYASIGRVASKNCAVR